MSKKRHERQVRADVIKDHKITNVVAREKLLVS